jgi:flagellar assembly factor FliW
MRRAVIVPMDGCEPFCWLASLEDENTRFVVVDPSEIYADYSVAPPVSAVSDTKTFAIVRVSSDWQKTTVNLRAPIVIDTMRGRGAQFILTESSYSLAEPIPQN